VIFMISNGVTKSDNFDHVFDGDQIFYIYGVILNAYAGNSIISLVPYVEKK
jgi:hypothetical protein